MSENGKYTEKAKFRQKMMIFGHFLLIRFISLPRRDARNQKNGRNTSKIGFLTFKNSLLKEKTRFIKKNGDF